MCDIRCYLHEDREPEHYIDARERVGVIHSVNGAPRPDMALISASRLCATRNGVDPERIVEWVES